MPDSDVQFLSAEQARYLVEMAERARAGLGRFVGHEVVYDATALQLLDEWVERVMEQSPRPRQDLRVLWMAFLGETFRRRFGGEWVAHEDGGQGLAVLCPAEAGGLHLVEVARQIRRRIANGFADSLALFYVEEGILLKQRKEI